MVLCDPMVDPRGGAFTVGLDLIEQVAVVPHFDDWSDDKRRRTLQIAPTGVPVVGIEARTALIREPDGAWRVARRRRCPCLPRWDGRHPFGPSRLTPPGRARPDVATRR